MSGDVFVDTNVLLCAFDLRDTGKRDRSQAWLAACWHRRCGRLSWQVLNEFYANARRRFTDALAGGNARAEVRRYQQWRPWVVDHATVETAWAVESRYRINYWDALMIASAQHQGCSILLTDDLQHDQQVEKLRIVNPFLVGPELLDAPAA